jgi:hypothetical protein
MTDLDSIRNDLAKTTERIDGIIETVGELGGRITALESSRKNGNGNGGVNWKQILMILMYLAAGGGGTATVMSAVTPKHDSGMTRAEIIELIKAVREP